MPSAEHLFSPRMIGEILNIVHNAITLIQYSTNRIIFANDRTARMFKTDIEGLLGQDFAQFFLSEDRETLAPNILKLTKEAGEFETEAMLRRWDGSTFLGLISLSVFNWDNDSGLAITIHDITKLKGIERLLKHSERRAFLGSMLNDISHQIRNPVLVIGGLARRLGTKVAAPKYVETIINESHRLEHLLDTLNDFIKLPRPRQKRLPLKRFIESVETRMKEIADGHGVGLQCNYDKDIMDMTLLVDADLLIKAFSAIMINACESYGTKDVRKEVVLQLFKTDEQLRPFAVRICDHGSGISPDDLPQAASLFFSKKTKHTGMGLTFAKRILEEQHGKLKIESEKGQGTTVTCCLIKERRREIRIRKFV